MPAEPAKDKQPLHPKRAENPAATRPIAPDKDLDKFVKKAWASGWWCQWGGQYVKCYSPDGVTIIPVVSTPSSQRTLRRFRSKFRQAGLDV